jgi:hypothetical protein
VYVSFGSSASLNFAALAVRVIDAFNAETLYCGGVLCTVLRISYRRCCLRGRRIDPVPLLFRVFRIRWMASISE